MTNITINNVKKVYLGVYYFYMLIRLTPQKYLPQSEELDVQDLILLK